MTEGHTASSTAGASAAPPLDVVVLGGGGHVGLPLSLAFADAGLRVGIFDINGDTLDRIARGEMPFLEQRGRRAAVATSCALAASSSGHRRT